MAEERNGIPVTPEMNELRVGNARRYSTGIVSSSKSDEKMLPNYLRASTGSCHDSCKYGHEHTFKAKEKRAIRKGISVSLDEYPKPLEIVTQPKRSRKPVVRPIVSPDSKVQVPGTPKVIKPETRHDKKKTSPSAKEKVVTEAVVAFKQKPVSAGRKSDTTSKSTSVKPKPAATKSPSTSSTSPRVQTGRGSTNTKTVENNVVSTVSQKKVSVLPRVSAYPKPTVKRVSSINARLANLNARVASVNAIKYRDTKGSSPSKGLFPLKNQRKIRKSETSQPHDVQVTEKTLYVIETSSVEKSSSTHGDCMPTSLSSPFSSSPPPVSPSSSSTNEVEKHIDSESTVGGDEHPVPEYKEGENRNAQCGECKTRSRRVAANHSEDKDKACKLNFRRGKVVNPQSDHTSPRKLRFRKVRLLGDSGKSDTRRRSFKKRESEDATIIKLESANVVLRHQDVTGKKDAQGLFNNVIEETASKLVQAKNSKVKALVGAFETVISLQESKPSPSSMT